LEDATISFLNARGVNKLYGSYQNRPVSEAATIRNWNGKLHAAGIQSQCLFSDNHRIFPAERAALLTKIENRVILFNDPVSGPPISFAERFHAVHLDLEPQALNGTFGYDWDDQSAADKRAWLLHLRDTYADIRDLLVSHGLATFPIYADLPVWFYKLPADGGQIGWLDAADRDQWFADIMTSLTGVSFMPFENPNLTAIVNSMSTEHTLIDPARIRIGHMCDVGATWPNYATFWMMTYALEDQYGSRAVDIQSYRRWREALSLPGFTAVPVSVALPSTISSTGGIGQVEVACRPRTSGKFVVLDSTNLCNWHEVRRFEVKGPGEIRMSFPAAGPRRFWRIVQIEGDPDQPIEPRVIGAGLEEEWQTERERGVQAVPQ
jgi:hypothetical protein